MRLAIILFVLSLTGCTSTTTLHTGSIVVNTPTHQHQTSMVYWTTTDRPFWFGTESGTIRLLTSCSTNTIQFDEQPNGIIFRRRQTDVPVVGDIPLNGVCGRIENADTIRDVDDELVLTLSCQNESNAFTVTNTEYPVASVNSYVIPITSIELTDDDKLPTLECKSQ